MWEQEHELVKKARLLATLVHDGQKRWGGEPYITHPAAVVKKLQSGMWYMSVFSMGDSVSDETLAVAWLHDVVEDTDVTLGQLLDGGFNIDIVKAVDAISHRDGEPYDEYIHRVKKDYMGRKVKIADIQHNLESFDHKKNKQRAEKYKMALLYLGSL